MGSCLSCDPETYDPYKIPTPEHHYEPAPQQPQQQPRSPSPYHCERSTPPAPQQPRPPSPYHYERSAPPAPQHPPQQRSPSPHQQLPSPSPQEITVLPVDTSTSAPTSASNRPATINPVPSREEPVRSNEDFHLSYTKGRELGFGAFAKVFVGIHNRTGEEYAVKQIDRRKMLWGDRDALEDEISNLLLLRDGPNIVQLYQIYEQPNDCFLVMELLGGGELFDRILEKRTFTEKEARDVCKCMLNALKYMHERRVAHRDLKPENLLLKSKKSDAELTLADFGFAKKVTTYNGCRTLCGTPGYLAPEILERYPAYDTKCDLFSVGVILFVLLGGYLPFDDKDEDKIFDRTRNGEYKFYPDHWNKVSKSAKNLVITLLTVNPSNRASAQLALDHEWMRRTDEALAKRKLSVEHLHQSIRSGKGKNGMKIPIHTAPPTNRLRKLNEDFESYLMNRSDSTSVFTVATKPYQRASDRKGEDSATGFPFKDFYEVGDLLGEGGFGVVRRAMHKKTKGSVAVKIVDRTMLVAGGEQALQDEIAALKVLRGAPHIVRLFDVFKEKRFTYIVMEEMSGGELLRRIAEKEVYTEREARSVCKILFSAVDYCHKMKIAHRDLKPDNLLLLDKKDDTSIKIADFGFARKITKPNCLTTLCGTAEYIAPEVLDLTSKGYDQRADMWSVGVIVYILLGGYTPFEGSIEELANVIQRGEYEFHDKYWLYTSTNAKDLISSCLQVNPNLRITAEGALESDWMTAEAETLIGNDLSSAQEQIRKTMRPVDKLKGAVRKVIIVNQLTSHTEAFTSTLGDAEAIQMRQHNRDDNRPSINATPDHGNMVEDSSSSKLVTEIYDLGMMLGTGNFSVVYAAVHKQTKQEFAINCVDRRDLHPSDAVALQDEITALRKVVACPQVVRLHEVFDEPDTSYLVFERMRGGELFERIIKKAHYTEADAKAVCKNLLLGVQFCHRKKIANRNLKPENLLLTSEENDVDVKISDFAYAKKVLFPNSLRTQCGTEGYVAPEILEHRPAYDVKCDMWSVGVILYILLGGYRPFRGSPHEVMRCIRYGEYEFHERYWKNISKEAKDLIGQMMTVDPSKRISANKALKSAWILADERKLQRDLSDNQNELKSFKGKAKMREVVQMIIALHKLQSLGEHYRKFDDF